MSKPPFNSNVYIGDLKDAAKSKSTTKVNLTVPYSNSDRNIFFVFEILI